MTCAQKVSIRNPHAVGAASDPLERAKRKKQWKQAGVEDKFRLWGIPTIFSCWGQRHPIVDAALLEAARRVERRRGIPVATSLRYWKRSLMATIWLRNADMIRNALYKEPEDALNELLLRWADEEGRGQREPPQQGTPSQEPPSRDEAIPEFMGHWAAFEAALDEAGSRRPRQAMMPDLGRNWTRLRTWLSLWGWAVDRAPTRGNWDPPR